MPSPLQTKHKMISVLTKTNGSTSLKQDKEFDLHVHCPRQNQSFYVFIIREQTLKDMGLSSDPLVKLKFNGF